jgi:hypothetical protein
VDALTWTFLVVVVLATAPFLLYLYMRYLSRIEDIKLETANARLWHERIWDPDNEHG